MKNTPESHSDYQPLVEAREKILHLADSLNQDSRLIAQTKDLLEIQQSITGDFVVRSHPPCAEQKTLIWKLKNMHWCCYRIWWRLTESLFVTEIWKNCGATNMKKILKVQ